mmetsp:Transcript_76134/g.149101  ORF Transcript_76134/g.149101 Transcript_76134/m.149101 type:complete len:202 (+) Transcript_76134:484-1089(+)
MPNKITSTPSISSNSTMHLEVTGNSVGKSVPSYRSCMRGRTLCDLSLRLDSCRANKPPVLGTSSKLTPSSSWSRFCSTSTHSRTRRSMYADARVCAISLAPLVFTVPSVKPSLVRVCCTQKGQWYTVFSPWFFRPLNKAQIWCTHRGHSSQPTHGSSCCSSFFFLFSSALVNWQSPMSITCPSRRSAKHTWHQWYLRFGAS